MCRLFKVALSSLCRSFASGFASNLICDYGDNLLVENYVLRVLSPLDPHKVRTGAGLDLGVTNLGPQKLEPQQFFPLKRCGQLTAWQKGQRQDLSQKN